MTTPDPSRPAPQPEAAPAEPKPYTQPRLVHHGRISMVTAGFSIFFPFAPAGPTATG